METCSQEDKTANTDNLCLRLCGLPKEEVTSPEENKSTFAVVRHDLATEQ